ncbi:hypothetical protein C7212DRAFT_345469 [Tuber magnatum]|uniref:Uncharacterized protein n=1 Tax=Tuber magnatum TaxID=42249 RepID=A0A317SL45_9PEZI|nr:hypothetical protein C7212DRAFT_345469 [Tuber magnatum]
MLVFEKLPESKYQRWVVQIKSTLQRVWVWCIVAREEVKPALSVNEENDETKWAIKHEIRGHWRRISEDLLLECISIDDVAVLGETIQRWYKDLVKERGHKKRGQLAKVSLQYSGTVGACFLHAEGLCADLAVVQGTPVSDQEEITAAMQGVPDEWNLVKAVIRGNVNYTYTDMKWQLKD